MSARVLNPMLMTDMRSGLSPGGRVVPTKAELAPIRRDLFGPVDHAANRALAERELRAQSRLDAERWGFDFQLGLPRCDARYAWEVVAPTDVVPEPYALRGMPYLRKHAPGTPRKINASPKFSRNTGGVVSVAAKKSGNDLITATTTTTTTLTLFRGTKDEGSGDHSPTIVVTPRKSEMTPPQELRVPDIGSNPNGETTPDDNVTREVDQIVIKQHVEDPTTPILPPSARKQSAITDFMKSRKRSLKGSTKSIVEPPEKMSRNTGQIRS